MGDPEEHDWEEEPEAAGVAVEVCAEVGDVEHEDDDGGVAGGGSEGAELLDIGDEVASAVGGGLRRAGGATFELGEALDEGEGEEEEDGEAGQPGGDGDSGGGGAGEDADGVEAGEDEDVDQDDALECEGVGGGGDGVDEEPFAEGVGGDEGVAEVAGDLREGEGDGGGGGEEEDDDGDAVDGGEVSGGEGAAAFGVVAAVGFDVEEVVDDVGGGGAEAEGEEGAGRPRRRWRMAAGPCQAWASRRGRKMRVFLAHWWRRMARSQAWRGGTWSRKMRVGTTWALCPGRP